MPTNNLDDLKTAWQELNQRLERQTALTVQQLKENKLMRFRSGLRPLVIGQMLQLMVGVVITVVSAQFWVNHIRAPHLLISGLLLHLYGIMFIGFAVRDLILIRQMDYAAPIVIIQKQLAQLRSWHVRTAIWLGMIGSVIWLPVFIILLNWLGVDVWITQPRTLYWLCGSVLVCLAVSYGLVLLSRSSKKCGRALASSWIGQSINRADRVLREIEDFEREVA